MKLKTGSIVLLRDDLTEHWFIVEVEEIDKTFFSGWVVDSDYNARGGFCGFHRSDIIEVLEG